MGTSNKELFDKYIKSVTPLNKDKSIDAIFEDLLNGKNSYLRMTKKGSSSFDPTWISVIEDVLFDLGEIINHPKEVTKTESNVTPIELAKKINGESVQHLASHTQYIKEVDEEGEVIPSKILSHSNIEDIHTYENRFIATFVRRLVLFVEKRFEFIRNTMNLNIDEMMYIKNKTIINGQEVEIETKIKVKKEENDQSAIEAKQYIGRISDMRDYLTYYYNSPFMKSMSTEKDVRKPILQTNIIRKNPKYRKCYETFLFIEKFDSLGVAYQVDENYQTFDEEERKRMNYLLLSQYLAIQDHEKQESIKRNKKVYKPKILTSIDDETFLYGDYLRGPIEFVRIDEQYREYLRKKVKEDLPEHPNKYEKEYYKDEYDYKKEQKMDEKELDKLIARKQKEIAKYEKIIEKLIEERNFEEAEAKRKELEAIREYETNLLEIKRQKIIEAAKNNKPTEEEIRSVVEDAKKRKEEAEKEEELAKELESKNKEVPAEETTKEKQEVLQNEEKSEEKPEEHHEEHKEVIYHVSGTSNVKYVDGHKVESFEMNEEVLEETPAEEEHKEEPTKEEIEKLVNEEIKEENIETAKEETNDVAPEVISIDEEASKKLDEEEKNQEPTSNESESAETPSIEENIENIEEPAQQEEKPVEQQEEKKSKKTSKKKKDNETEKTDNEPEEKQNKEEPIDNQNESEPHVEPEPVDILKVIPGKFIVKTNDGYYVKDGKYSKNKNDAHIFDDFNIANQKKKQFGGKVIKL